jgi:CRP-like cAMP-binding protein
LGKQPKSSAQVRDGGASSPCAQCRIRPFNICKVLLDGKGASPRQPSSHPDWQAHNKIAPHKIIKTVGERLDRVHVVCAGWAFRYVQLANGRRQVLSILAPGDVITPSRPFDDVVSYSVQAVTEVRYCGYSRPLLKDRLVRDPHLFAAWAELMIAERKQNFSMLIELGSLSAEERLADFLIQLVARLSQRPSLVEDPILIPLPQWLIAAALGLTTEHVSRVIGAFRQRNMVESGRGFLRIVDLHELRRIVGMRT